VGRRIGVLRLRLVQGPPLLALAGQGNVAAILQHVSEDLTFDFLFVHELSY
jgi:hypothetical protein